jgi:hypothetical protein
MLQNISLLLRCLLKALWMTGLGPGALLLTIAERFRARFHAPLKLGHIYKISGYHYGDFIGEVLSCDRDKSRVRVVDPLRPMTRAKNPCCFPMCVREDFHGGEHGFVTVREGVILEVSWALAKWMDVSSAPISGGDQLANRGFLKPALEVPATRSPRIRRSA